MAIGDILKKLMGGSRASEGERVKGMSPDEVELQSYMEEERRDNLKKLLGKYREKKSKEMLMGNTLVDQGKGSVIGAKNVMNGKSTLIKNSNNKKRTKNRRNIFF